MNRIFLKNPLIISFIVAILFVLLILLGALGVKGVAYAEEGDSQNQDVLFELDEKGKIHMYSTRCATKCLDCDYVRVNKIAHKALEDTEYQYSSIYEHGFICADCGEQASEMHVIKAPSGESDCTLCLGEVALSMRSNLYLLENYKLYPVAKDAKTGATHFGEFSASFSESQYSGIIPVIQSKDITFDNSIIKEIVEFTEVEPNNYSFTLIGYDGEQEECTLILELKEDMQTSCTPPEKEEKPMSCMPSKEEEIVELIGIATAVVMAIALVVALVVIIVRNKRK